LRGAIGDHSVSHGGSRRPHEGLMDVRSGHVEFPVLNRLGHVEDERKTVGGGLKVVGRGAVSF
jgi:hypothetical protein